MKICYVTQYLPRIGGLELIVSDLAMRLAGEGHEIHVVTTHIEGTPEEETMDGVQVHRFKSAKLKFRTPLAADWILAMYRKLKDVVKANDIRLLHAHFAKTEAVVAVRVGNKLKLPVITTGHGSDLMFEYGGFCATKWSRSWVKYALEHSDYITTVSNALKLNAMKLGINERKIRVIHNWFDPDKYQLPGETTKARIRKELAWDSKIILTSRRLVKKNGVDILVNALKKLDPELDTKLVVIGDGPEKDALTSLAKQVKTHEVEFVSFTDFEHYINMLNACDLYVIPSRWEGFGMVILEAWAARVPVVATEVGGIPEIIENGKNGVLVPPISKNLAKGIESVIGKLDYRQKLVAGATERLDEHFTWPRAREQWLELYMEALRK